MRVALIIAAIAIGVQMFGPEHTFLSGGNAIAKERIPAGIETIDHHQLTDSIKQGGIHSTLLFIYASWCPYCKKQMHVLRDIHSTVKNLEILAISTDKNPQKLAQYLAGQPKIPFKHPLYIGTRNLKELINAYGGHYTGAIPYIALFKNGKMKAGISGYTESRDLKEILSQH